VWQTHKICGKHKVFVAQHRVCGCSRVCAWLGSLALDFCLGIGNKGVWQTHKICGKHRVFVAQHRVCGCSRVCATHQPLYVLDHRSHCPLIVDPTQGTGQREALVGIVWPLAMPCESRGYTFGKNG